MYKEMLKESRKRLGILNLNNNIERDFHLGWRNMSYENTDDFILFNDELLEIVDKFEFDNHALVYHVIKSTTDAGGEALIFLYVDIDDEKWALQKAQLSCGKPICYIYFVDVPYCSRFDTVTINVNQNIPIVDF